MTPTPLSRRSVLIGALGAGSAFAVGSVAAAPASAAPQLRSAAPLDYPFTLGVASGDPHPDGMVLWTRLALDPLAADGRGGMPDRPVNVDYQLAYDPEFRRVVRSGRVDTRPRTAHSLHVELTSLPPGREYWYRFKAEGHISPVGRTLTAPAYGASVAALRTAVASCAQYEHGYFTAYRHLAEESPDLVLHLGDYQYEYAPGQYLIPGGNVRDHKGPETVDLAGYRQRHAQYKADPDLQAAHAAAPWVVVFDDHEVENNWADDISENEDPVAFFRARRAAAFQAYYENMPLRRRATPNGPDIPIYRRLFWGSLASFNMLDTRQFRSDQAAGDGVKPVDAESLDPRRSILGKTQERWLLDGLARSRSTWDVLGQQVFFAQSDFAPGPAEIVNMDAWDGYEATRDRILGGIAERGIVNPVVLTGDIHSHWANELKADFRNDSSATVGVELVTTSITAGGNGSEVPSFAPNVLAENPHVKFAGNRRGYILATYTADELRADYRVVDDVRTPGAPIRTQASFVVEEGNPGLNPV